MNTVWLSLRAFVRRCAVQPGSHAMLLWAASVGAAGAASTILFREAIDLLQSSFGVVPGDFVEMARHMPWPVRIALPAVGGLLAGVCLMVAKRKASGSAKTDYMEAISVGDGVIPVWQSLWRTGSSIFTIASGGSIGREGSMIQLAALSASMIGRFVRFDVDRLRMLVACGAAAGITAAYSAPIAGAFFVAELILGTMTMRSFGPVLIASVVSNVIMRGVAGYSPPYQMPSFAAVTGAKLIPFLLLGLICGLLAPLSLRAISQSRAWFAALRLPVPVRLCFGGLIVGVISVWVPEVWGNGFEVVSAILHQPWPWQALLVVLVMKLLATLASVGSGAIGGVFTPTLFFGAVVGCLFGTAMQHIWPAMEVTSTAFAMVGMGAFLAAATNAPVMAMLMIFEMTLSYAIVLPLMLSSVIAYYVARKVAAAVAMYEITVQRNEDQLRLTEKQAIRVRDLIKPADTIVFASATLQDVRATFAEYRARYIYVIDAARRYCGIIAFEDLAVSQNDANDGRRTATDMMRTGIKILHPDMTLSEAAQCFVDFKGERLPVIETKVSSRRIVGVVHKSRLIEALNHLQLRPSPGQV